MNKFKKFNFKKLWLIFAPIAIYVQVERLQDYFQAPADFKSIIIIHLVLILGLLMLFIDAIPGLGLSFLDVKSKVPDSDKNSDENSDETKETS